MNTNPTYLRVTCERNMIYSSTVLQQSSKNIRTTEIRYILHPKVLDTLTKIKNRNVTSQRWPYPQPATCAHVKSCRDIASNKTHRHGLE